MDIKKKSYNLMDKSLKSEAKEGIGSTTLRELIFVEIIEFHKIHKISQNYDQLCTNHFLQILLINCQFVKFLQILLICKINVYPCKPLFSNS